MQLQLHCLHFQPESNYVYISMTRINSTVSLTKTTNVAGHSYFVTVLCVSWKCNPNQSRSPSLQSLVKETEALG